MGHPRLVDSADVSVGTMATVTGIRHWSTATYTRVAIDLAVAEDVDVKYEAARVEHPDRLFFDLHHARLAPGLVGKSFTVADDGFLTRIRAAQSGDDVTRVVLDVHAVGEYSAFLLPNPERLIIDIHGRAGIREQGTGIRDQAAASGTQEVTGAEQRSGTSNPVDVTEDAVAPTVPAPVVAPVASERVVSAAVEPVAAAPVVRQPAGRAVEVSSLPPMPVTDGSAAFGLPARGAGSAKAVAVAAASGGDSVEADRGEAGAEYGGEEFERDRAARLPR